MNPKDQWHLLEWIERARDGKLGEDDRARLEETLHRDPAARSLLARALQQDAELRLDERLTRQLADESAPAKPASRAFRHGVLRFAGLAAALAVLGGIAGFFLHRNPGGAKPAVATLTRAQQCKWSGSTLPTAEGSRVGPGTLELAEGLATLRFDSGAEVIMEAPATLQLINAMNCRLQRGTVVAQVPPSAKGFSVDTREARVVDYGTRFGVSAGDDGKYLVQVLEGLVEVNHKADHEVKQLRGGQSMDRGLLRNKVSPQAAEFEPNRWQPNVILDGGDGWQVISTAFGRGRDSFIQSGDKVKDFGRAPFFRVKRTTLAPELNRKGYVCFDISKFQGQSLSDAELVLTIEPSDLGFASLVPDSSFAVYGLSDESQDDWEEDALSWQHAPAHDPAQPDKHLPIPGQSVLLGHFEIPQGINRGTRTLRGAALLDFLRRDHNGLVTFIICRETDETAKNGFVHAFATKENPANTPPLLRVKIN